jgi:hypothetical protein
MFSFLLIMLGHAPSLQHLYIMEVNTSLFSLSGNLQIKKFNVLDTIMAKTKMHAMTNVTQSSSIPFMAWPCLAFG